MTFRDLSYWGIFRIILIINWAIPILLTPLILVYWLIAPGKFYFDGSGTAKIYGITINSGEHGLEGFLSLLPAVIIISFIGLLIQTAILYLIARHTPIGKIKLGGH